MHSLQEIISNISRQTINATMPTGLYFGTVIQTSPLEIMLEQKLTLTTKQLILTSAVSDFSTSMSVNGGAIQRYSVYNGLAINEKVILLRVQGGQKFVVLDRVR